MTAPAPDAPPADPRVGLVMSIAQRSPVLAAVMALLMFGGGGGALSSYLVSPYVSEAVQSHERNTGAHLELLQAHDADAGAHASGLGLDEHERDPRAHATEFERLKAIDARLGTIEAKMDDQSTDIATMNGNLAAAIQLLQTP